MSSFGPSGEVAKNCLKIAAQPHTSEFPLHGEKKAFTYFYSLQDIFARIPNEDNLKKTVGRTQA